MEECPFVNRGPSGATQPALPLTASDYPPSHHSPARDPTLREDSCHCLMVMVGLQLMGLC